MNVLSSLSFKAKVKDFYTQGYQQTDPYESSEIRAISTVKPKSEFVYKNNAAYKEYLKLNSELPPALIRKNPDPLKGKTDIESGDVFIYQKPDKEPVIGKMTGIGKHDYGNIDQASWGPSLQYTDVNQEEEELSLLKDFDIYTAKEYQDEVLDPTEENLVDTIFKLKTDDDIIALEPDELNRLEKALTEYSKLNEQRETIKKLSVNA